MLYKHRTGVGNRNYRDVYKRQGVRTMQQIMEKSVPGSGPQFYFVFRENELIGYNFLIGDTKKYKALDVYKRQPRVP